MRSATGTEQRARCSALPSSPWLALVPPGLGPQLGVTPHMKDGKHYNSSSLDAVQDGIWKPRYDCAAHFAMHAREHLRILLDRVERSINSSKELLPEPRALFFVPSVRTGQVPSNFPTADDR